MWTIQPLITLQHYIENAVNRSNYEMDCNFGIQQLNRYDAFDYRNVIGLDFIPKSSYKVFSDASNTIGKARHFFGRLNRLKEISRKNYESVPENATIRKEYIKCGNYSCRRCKHGPYYYAYWTDRGMRHKKYLGKYDPRDKQSLELTDLSPFIFR